jgi:hypothetical protein
MHQIAHIQNRERSFWMVFETWRASKYISDTRASLTIVELMPLAA